MRFDPTTSGLRQTVIIGLTLGLLACSKSPADWLAMEALDDTHVALVLGRSDRCEIGVASVDGWLWRSDEPDCAATELRATTGTIAFKLVDRSGQSRLVMATRDGQCRQVLRDTRLRASQPWTAAAWPGRRVDMLGESAERLMTSFSDCAPLLLVELPADTGRAQVEAGYLGLDRVGAAPHLQRTPDGQPNPPIEIRPVDGEPHVFAGSTVSAWGPTALLYEGLDGRWWLHDVPGRRHVPLRLDREPLGLLRGVWQRDDALVLFTENDNRTTLTRLDPQDGTVTATKVLDGTIGGLRKDKPVWWTGAPSLGLVWFAPDTRGPDSLVRVDDNLELTFSKAGPAPYFAQVGPTALLWTRLGDLHLLEPGRPARLVARLSPPTPEDRLTMPPPIAGARASRALWWVDRDELRRIDLDTSRVDDVLSW